METLINFITEHWYLFLLALIIGFIVIKVVKIVFRLVLLLIIIVGIFVLFTDVPMPQSVDEVKLLTKEVKQDVTAKTEEEVLKQIVKRVDGAEYQAKDNGDFTLTYDGMIARGNQFEEEVQIYVNGEIHSMKKSDAIKHIHQFINDK